MGGVVRSMPRVFDETTLPHAPRQPRGGRASGLAVVFAALLALILVGGLLGRFVYQVVQRPITIYARAGAGCDGVKRGDVLQMWAYPFGRVLASPTSVRTIDGGAGPDGPARLVATFEINRHTPDFQIVDTSATEYSNVHSYWDFKARAGPAVIDVCEDNILRLTPRVSAP
jgi:hypothetical protein